MRKILLTITAIGFFSIVALAQIKADTIQQLQNSIEKLEASNKNLTNQLNTANFRIQKIDKRLSTTADSINILKNNLANTNSNLQTITDNIDVKIQQTSDKASSGLTTLSETVSKNTLYWIIAVLFIALLSVLLFVLLKKQLSKEKTGLSDQIKKTSDSLREEQLKLDGQLIKLLDTQTQLIHEESKTDHSLAINIANQIIRIQNNLNGMDVGTPGRNQIQDSLKRMKEKFESKDYEIVEMIGKKYDKGLIAEVTPVPCEDNQEPNTIIRIIEPQVNFKGKMINPAKIRVTE